jgi:hypothetical protein
MLLKQYAAGPKPVRTQLCLCLAVLAMQMTDWHDVLSSVVSALAGSENSHAPILDFLRVLPEEVIEGRRIALSVCAPRRSESPTNTCRLNRPATFRQLSEGRAVECGQDKSNGM